MLSRQLPAAEMVCPFLVTFQKEVFIQGGSALTSRSFGGLSPGALRSNLPKP